MKITWGTKTFVVLFVFGALNFILPSQTIYAVGSTYYVDSSITDTNVGSATPDCTNYDPAAFTCSGGSGSAYKTIADVNLKSFSPDDQILFRKGQTWREKLVISSSGTSGHPITYSTFGTGASPVITGADNFTGFVDGGSNIWDKTSVTVQPNVVIVNGVAPIMMVASRAAVTSAGKWFWTANTLSVYATSDPSGTVEAGQRDYAIDTNGKNFLTFSGLTVERSNFSSSNGGFYAHFQPSNIIIDNCTMTQNAASGIYINGLSPAFTIQNSTLSYNGQNGIGENPNDNLLQNVLHNTINDNGWAAAALGGFGSGFQGYAKTGEFAYNTVYANGVPGPADSQHGFYFGSVIGSTVTMHDNEVYGHTMGAGVKSKSSISIYNNYLHDNTFGALPSGNGTVNVVFDIHHNIISNNTSTGLYELQKGAGTLTLNAYNNTLYNNAGGGNGSWNITDNLTAMDFRNNIVTVSAGPRIVWFQTLQTGTINIDNNLYYQPTSATPFRSVSTGLSFSQWQALGYDTHSLNLDPLLTNVAGNNFTLTSLSPAIDTGSNIGSTYQAGLGSGSIWPSSVSTINQNTNGIGWDMGAYIFTESTAPTVSLATPGTNGSVSGPSVTLSATASDNSAIAGVQFKLDTNTNIGAEDTASTYGVTWDSTAVSDGAHTLIAVARDTYGNYATSSPVTITVNNAVVAATPYPSGHRRNIITAESVLPVPALSVIPTLSPSSLFTTNHRLGDKDPDIKDLQIYLNDHGFTIATSGPGSKGNETSTFGSLTYKALINYQKSKGLPATGWFGPMTRGAMGSK